MTDKTTLATDIPEVEESITKREKRLSNAEDEHDDKRLRTNEQKRNNNGESTHRRKFAVLLAYCGQGYFGMQRNPGVKTIEDDLLMAMLKAGLITQEQHDVPHRVHFQRAARTDKGVSAANQVVSLCLVPKTTVDCYVDEINAYLPSSIKVINVKRATRGFNSKLWCDARTYSYTLPSFAFSSVTEATTEDYRITDERLREVNSILSIFKGTHNFHNFTSGKKPNDASACRYIMEFLCGEKFVSRGVEFLVIKVKGQSFMLHQIRKMIGVTIAIVRNLASRDVIDKSWKEEKVDIPIAPGLGLVLEEVHYDKYNARYSNDGIHEALSWNDKKEEISEFREKSVLAPIVNKEIEEKSMLQWLETLPLHSYDVREEGPPTLLNKSQTRNEFGRALKAVELHQETTKDSDGSVETTKVEPVEINPVSKENGNESLRDEDIQSTKVTEESQHVTSSQETAN